MKPRISMITLGVRNLAAAVKFYEEGLGFPRLESPPEVAFFTLHGTWLGLYGRDALAEDATVSPDGYGFEGFTLAHNVHSEAEVDAVIAQALAAGATLVKKPQKVFWGGYSGYLGTRTAISGRWPTTRCSGSGLMTDPFRLNRFVEAQAVVFEQALAEIKAGRKRSHWMWFIFPQIEGLGFSPTSAFYSIKSIEEAKAYLEHPILGPRLVQFSQAALSVEGRSALEIFGHPDDLKLKSCATLFAGVSPTDSVFQRLLEKYFQGHMDEKMLRLIGLQDQK